MDGKDWVKNRIRSIGWAGIIAGFLLSVLLQPYAVSFATHAYNDVGVPGYQTPEPETNIDQIPTIYPEGKEIEDFNGLEWESNHRLYRLSINNPSNRILRGVTVDIPLPGCAVYTNTEGPAVSGDYSVGNEYSARVQTDVNSSVNKYHCTKEIRAGTMTPGESIQVEFVVKQEFQDCTFLVGAVPEDDYRVEYVWSKSNTLFEESYLVKMTSLREQYTQTRDMYLGKNTILGPYKSEGSDWELHGIVTGVEADSGSRAIKKCYARQVMDNTSP